MMLTNRFLLVATAAMLVLAGTTRADDEETATIESTIAKDAVPSCVGACRVNFLKEYDLALEYLDSIGQEIHEARLTPDPVQLALCAKGLAVAEQVSGKKASVTSDQVMKEAIKLAKLRGNSEELRAVAALTDEATSSDLDALAEVAAEAEAEAREATKSGEAERRLNGYLTVVNHSDHCLRIQMDGRNLGIVHEGNTRSFHVHNQNWHNHFDAYCIEDGALVHHGDYSGDSRHLTWHIH